MGPFDYDVIICGAGTAGQTAATFASKRGARVLAVDSAAEIGGNTQRSTGQISAAGTRLQAERAYTIHRIFTMKTLCAYLITRPTRL